MTSPYEILPHFTSPMTLALAGILTLFWTWESWRPAKRPDHRVRHAGRNLILAFGNTVILSILFGGLIVFVAEWSAREQFGLLHWLAAPGQTLPVWLAAIIAFILL